MYQAEDGIRELVRSRGLVDGYKRQRLPVPVEYLPVPKLIVKALVIAAGITPFAGAAILMLPEPVTKAPIPKLTVKVVGVASMIV